MPRWDVGAPTRDGSSLDEVPTSAADDTTAAPELPTSVNLAEAVVRAQSGDEDAFRIVYRTVQPGLLRYVRALVGEDAEDVASETWAQIARDLDSFAGGSDEFRSWAATIARHRALDHLRHLRRRPVATIPVDALPERSANDDTEAQALEIVSTDAAIALIATLPREQAEAVLLRVVMGLDAEAAGRVLGKRAGAVRTAAHRGLRRLASQMDGRGGFWAAPGSPRKPVHGSAVSVSAQLSDDG